MSLRFAFKPYRVPFRAPVRTAHGLWTEREGLYVRVEDEAGRTGCSEIAPLPWFGTETLAEAAEACARLGDRIGPDVLETLPARLGCVRYALEQALAEIRPDTASAGGGPRLPVAALLPAGRAALATVDARLESGFLAFKWKVGVGRPEEELPVLDDLLARLPAYAKLRLDANGAWDHRTAGRWLSRLAERPVEFLEQPVPPDQVDVLLGLAGDYPVTLALDEAVTGLEAAQLWQERGWTGVFVIKPALAGPWPEVAAWIGRSRADVVFSSAFETALGRVPLLRRILAGPLTRRALGFGVDGLFGDRRWDGPVVGPLLDSSWGADWASETAWNAVT